MITKGNIKEQNQKTNFILFCTKLFLNKEEKNSSQNFLFIEKFFFNVSLLNKDFIFVFMKSKLGIIK